jgi:uncharacterized membrane protein
VATLLDTIFALLVAIWLAGGIPWHGHWLLRHGADPRRMALGLVLFVFTLSPGIRAQSRVYAWALRIRDALMNPTDRRLALALAAALGAIVCVFQALALRSTLYDVGIFHQILWALAHGHGFVSTISGAGNFLLDHFSPSLALLTPAFWLSGSSPLTLAVLQPILLFAGASAWVFLAARAPGATAELRRHLAAATTLVVVFFDSLWANFTWGFHESAIAFVALSWALALLLTRKGSRWLVLLLILIAAGSKEILLVDCALVLAAWACTGELGSGFRALLAFLSVALIGVFLGFESIHHPADKNYFIRYYSYLGSSLGECLRHLPVLPGLVFENVGASALSRYVLDLLMPWLALPLLWWIWLWKRPSAQDSRFAVLLLLSMAPSFYSAALATYPPLRNPGFHYVLELWPVLAALTILALARIGNKKWVWAWALVNLLWFAQDPWGQFREYSAEAHSRSAIRQRLAEIPVSESVAADEMAGSWVAGRLKVTRWADLSAFEGGCPDWVITVGVAPDPNLAAVAKNCGRGIPQAVWSAENWTAYRMGLNAQ